MTIFAVKQKGEPMTDREKAIVMAYTGICMLEGSRLYEFYAYLKELYSRPVYSHELLTLNIKERSEKDFMDLCREVDRGRRTGIWIPMTVSGGRDSWKCSICGRRARGKLENLPYCHCGAKMKGADKDDNN